MSTQRNCVRNPGYLPFCVKRKPAPFATRLNTAALTLNLLAPTTVGARINPQAANVIYMYIYDYIYIYIYGAPILDVSRSHTTTHQSR